MVVSTLEKSILGRNVLCCIIWTNSGIPVRTRTCQFWTFRSIWLHCILWGFEKKLLHSASKNSFMPHSKILSILLSKVLRKLLMRFEKTSPRLSTPRVFHWSLNVCHQKLKRLSSEDSHWNERARKKEK